MFTSNAMDELPRIAADVLREALLRTSDATVYRLQNTAIDGDLDLSHRQISRPVEIHGCHFLGKVDLRYGEFLQTIDLTNCVFHEGLNSGDKCHTRAIYRKDLICTGVRFKHLVSFNRAIVEGHASFRNAHFEAIDEDGCSDEVEGAADFAGMLIERNFICNGAVFHRGVSFNALHCRTAEFHSTRFESKREIDFRSAHFRGNIEFYDPRVENRYVEDQPMDSQVTGDHAAPFVRGKLIMRGFRCDRRAIFIGVEFAGKVDCEDAFFGWYLDCRGACFKDRVSFVRAKCDGAGLFTDATFEHGSNDSAADFRYARFQSLKFSRAVFRGRVHLGQVRIEEKLRLDEARFHQDVLLYGARLGTIVLLNEGYKFSDVVHVSDDQQGNRPDGTGASVGPPRQVQSSPCCSSHNDRSSEFQKMHNNLRAGWQSKRQTLEEEDVRDWLDTRIRRDAQIRKTVTDYFFPFQKSEKNGRRQSQLNAQWTRIWSFRIWPPYQRTIDPEPAPHGLELNGCTFARIHAGPVPALADELIRAFTASQKVDRFSRDVYLQLERYYNQTGNEAHANEVHLWGHLATRRNACTKGGAIRWSFVQKTKDFLLMLTGWGLLTWRIWALCLLIVLTGTFYFGMADGVLRVKHEPNATISGIIPGVGEVSLIQSAVTPQEQAASSTTASGTLPDCSFWERTDCWLRRGGYSLTTFIPAVSLGLDQGWEPAKGTSEVARLMLVLSGWLFVPLGVAAMTGIIRSDKT